MFYNELIKQIDSMPYKHRQMLFRGEPQNFEHISSGFYRMREKGDPRWAGYSAQEREEDMKICEGHAVSGAGVFEGVDVEREYELFATFMEDNPLDQVPKESWETLGKIRQAGGKTNFIDFSRDVNIAIYFACSDIAGHPISRGKSRHDGRIVIYRPLTIPQKHPIMEFPHAGYSKYQSSVFVRPREGGSIPLDEDVLAIPVPKEEKLSLLSHLDVYCNVRPSTVYPDLGGYVRNEGMFFSIKEEINAKYK